MAGMKVLDAQKRLICEADIQLRPSDWAVRLASLGSSFGRDRRLRFSPYLRPVSHDGRRCLCLYPEMEREQPGLLKSILHFAEQNRLQLIETAE